MNYSYSSNRFENRLNMDSKYFNVLRPVWDNTQCTALNVFEMIDLLNEYNIMLLKLDIEKWKLENRCNILDDFILMLNRLQADPENKNLLMQSRDMLRMMGVELLE